jgi:hypothetical protein
VTERSTRRPASLRRAAILTIALTLVPLPLLAADPPAAAPAQPLKSSIEMHAKRDVLVTPAKQSLSTGQSATRAQGSNDPHQPGFFRSPAGIACLAVIAAGTGYALYSASHDRIHSVARQKQ